MLQSPLEVKIRHTFDFKSFNVTTEEEKQKFLKKMCVDSINKPIIQYDEVTGVITRSEINDTNDGIITHGLLWGNIEQEFIKDESGYSLSTVVLSERKVGD